VRQVRSVIFEMQTSRLPGRSLRQAILELTAESARSLGFEPRVAFDGPVDSLVDDAVAEHVLAVLREALSNVARHAGATSVEVSVSTDADHLTVSVTDDGRGVPDASTGGRGLDNMRVRATRLFGDVTIGPGPGGIGTGVHWTVPLE
jgi:signal transduction histidine kinase